MTYPKKILLLIAAFSIASGQALGADGIWKFAQDNRDQPELTYVESGKTIFFLGCGRAVGFHIVYPGKDRPGGRVSLSIANTKSKLIFPGEIEMGFDDDDSTTPYVVSWNFGLDQGMPGITEKLKALFAVITVQEPLVISAEKGNYQIPPVSIPGVAAKFMKECSD
jgi:hypothetical protein